MSRTFKCKNCEKEISFDEIIYKTFFVKKYDIEQQIYICPCGKEIIIGHRTIREEILEKEDK